MFGSLRFSGLNFRLIRKFHIGKHFSNPCREEIIFKSVCVNLRQRRWDFLDQVSPNLSNSLVSRVICYFQSSSQLALDFFNWVQEKSTFSPSLQCYCAIIHVLATSKSYEDALGMIRNLIQIKGFTHLEILDALANSYEECGSCPGVFDTLVRACGEIGNLDGAYEVIQRLKSEGCWVSIHAWNNLLNHLIKLDGVDRFWKVYREMVACGYVENVNTFNLLIFALCKEANLLQATSVLYRMLKRRLMPNVVSFNMLVDGACREGNLNLAFKLVRKMGFMSGNCVKPNVITYNCLINGLCKMGGASVAKEVLDEMVRAGVKPNVRTYATLVDGHSREGSIDVALKMCDEMVEKGLMPNTVVYNSIIHWLYKEGDVEGASTLLSDMMDKCLVPDQFTHSILTKGLCRNGNLNEALSYRSQILDKNIVEDAFVHNILIDYVCQSGDIIGSQQLLGSMFLRGLIPDLVTHGTLINYYSKEGNIENAVQTYEKMIEAEEKPNLIIYNSIINGLCKGASLNSAELLLDALKRRGSLDVITCNTMLKGYCINGRIEEGVNLFHGLTNMGISMNIVTYNTLLNYLCKSGFRSQAKELMKKMLLMGVVPDPITYTTLITNFCKTSTQEEVVELHDNMDEDTHQDDKSAGKATGSTGSLLGAKNELWLKVYGTGRKGLEFPFQQVIRHMVHEVVLAADVHCKECQKRLAGVISRVNVDTESIMVHVSQKKVILTRNSITNSSRTTPSCFPNFRYRVSKILSETLLILKLEETRSHDRKVMLYGNEDQHGLQWLLQKKLDTHLIEMKQCRVVVCGKFIPKEVAIKIRKKTNRRVEILEIQDFNSINENQV
ncbi:Pentatricopeptide repeat [Dillenia turbinata]|uniref:Pentatricopeptide repeat n=1 Tax=Dillenia turbinata TaxID=194707 RepID=A0AAN8V0B4_9MAGN